MINCMLSWSSCLLNLVCSLLFYPIFQFRQSTLARMGITDPKEFMHAGTTHEPSEKEYAAWRMKLREKQYLSTPLADNIFSSLSGEELDPQLVELTATGHARREYFFQKYFSDDETDLPEEVPDPIFVTPEERSEYFDVSNKTIDVIKKWTSNLFFQIDSDTVRQVLQDDFSELTSRSNVRKSAYIAFYNRVREEVDGQMDVVPVLPVDTWEVR